MLSPTVSTTSIYIDPVTPAADQQHSTSHSQKYSMVCSCCPYGYHIDLDFVQYCESLAANSSTKRNGTMDQSVAARRRQRKSMEVMLGVELNDFHTVWDQCLEELSPTHYDPQLTASKARTQIHLTRLSPPPLTPPPFSAPPAKTTTNSEFNFEDLDEAVNDFERTLRRSSMRTTKTYVSSTAKDELDHLMTNGTRKDACITSSHHYSHTKYTSDYNNFNDDEKLRKSYQTAEEAYESRIKNLNAPSPPPIPVRSSLPPSPPIRNRIPTELQSQVLSLNRIRSLEEEVKIIPDLQLQLSKMKEENHDLQQRLANSERRKLSRTTGSQTTEATETATSTPPLTTTNNMFNLHRISPISLQSFNNKMASEGLSPTNTDYSQVAPTPPPRNARIYRDVGVLALSPQVVTRDVGCSSSPRVRSVACHTDLSVMHLEDKLFTQQQVNDCIQQTIERFDRPEKQVKTVGVQMTPLKTSTANQFCQSEVPRTISVGINVEPEQRSVMLMTKPEVRTVGISVVQEVEKPKPCEKCHVQKRSIGVGGVVEEVKLEKLAPPAISLKALDFSTVDAASKPIQQQQQFKTTSTQCHTARQESIGVQHQPQTADKASQNVVVKKTVRGTDTKDLIRTFEQATNTKPPAEIATRDACCETNPIYLIESSISAINIPGTRHKENATNTDVVNRSETSCGTEEMIVTSTDNYCDSCKNLIKNLAQEATSPTTPQSPGVVSKIPRAVGLPSPHTQRKFTRQDTYTLPPEIPCSNLPDVVEEIQPVASSSTELFSERPAPTSTGIATKITATPASSPSVNTEEHVCPAEIVLRRSLERQLQSQLSSENRDMLPSSSTSDNGPIMVPCNVTRPKPSPSKEMLAALKVINDSLHKSSNAPANLKNANKIVQKEWFKISSTENASAAIVEAYLDHFEGFSSNLLRYMVNLIDSNGNTAMHYAVSHCNFDIVSILLDSKVLNVNQTNNSGYTCIMLVSLAKLQAPEHHSVIRKLFSMSDVNIRARKHSQTALMLACSHGNIDMVSLLLENGADLNIQDEDGSTALMCSAEHGHFEIVKLLLSHQECDSTIQDIDGSTALKISLEAGYRDIGVLLYAHEHMSRNGSLKRRNKKSRTTSQSSTT